MAVDLALEKEGRMKMFLSFMSIVFIGLIGACDAYIFKASRSSTQWKGLKLLHVVEDDRWRGAETDKQVQSLRRKSERSTGNSLSKPRRDKKEFTKNNQRNERQGQGISEWQSGNAISEANNRPRGRRRYAYKTIYVLRRIYFHCTSSPSGATLGG